MTKYWIYRIINHIIDFITNQDINRTLKKVISIEKFSRTEIIEYQQVCFEKLLEVAKKTNEYAKINSNSLEDFPIVSKNDYKERKNNFISTVKPFAFDSTSGTSGEPFIYPVSMEKRLMKRVSHQKLLHWYGIAREEREIKIGGGYLSFKTKIYHILRNKRHIASNQLQNNYIDKVIDYYNKFKPGVLYGYPSAIRDFLYKANVRGKKLHFPKIVITHAENLTNDMINYIKSQLPGVPVANQYWATEANIAAMCPMGNLHIDEDTVIPELINIDNKGFGNLVITNLYSYCFPIIRYKIGDQVKFSDKECECGLRSKIIEEIKGRDSSLIKLNNGHEISLGDTVDFEEYTKKTDMCQLVYYTKPDKLQFLYKSKDNLSNYNKQHLESYFMKYFEMKIDIIETEDFVWEKSGKLLDLKQI